MILVGAHDFICGPLWASLTKEAIPDAEMSSFPQSGNFAHIEEADKFARVVKYFIDLHQPEHLTSDVLSMRND